MDFNNRQFVEIKNLILSLTKANYKKNVQALQNLMNPTLYSVTLKFLFENISIENRSEKDECLIHLLRSMFHSAKSFSSFPSILVGIFEDVLRRKQKVLDFIIKDLQLSLEDQFLVAVTLSQDENLRNEGIRLLKARINEFLKIYDLVGPSVQQSFYFLIDQAPEFSNQRDQIFQMLSSNARGGYTHMSPMFDQFDQQRSGEQDRLQGTNEVVINEQIEQEPNAPIVNLVREIGFIATASKKIFRIILKDSVKPINEKIAGQLLVMMSRDLENTELMKTDKLNSFLRQKNREKLKKEIKKYPSMWNVGVLCDTLRELAPNLNYAEVVSYYDTPFFQIENSESFKIIYKFFQRTHQSFGSFLLRRQWKTIETQSQFLYYSLVVDCEDLKSKEFSQVNLGELSNMPEINLPSVWMNLEVIAYFLQVARLDEHLHFVRSVFEYALRTAKIPLLCGIAQAGVDVSIGHEIIQKVLHPFVKQKGTYNVVGHVTHLNSAFVMRNLFVMYGHDYSLCPRIVDCIEENRELIGMISYQPWHLSLTLAVVSSRRSIIKLQQILNQNINSGMKFLSSVLVFTRSMLQNPSSFGMPSPMSKAEHLVILTAVLGYGQDSPEVVRITQDMIRYVRGMGENGANENGMENNMLPQTVLSLHPAQQNQQQLPHQRDPNQQQEFIPDAVERWSTRFFESMFAGQLSIDIALKTIRDLKDDKSDRAQQKYATLVHNMFDEFRFFDQYPNAQLRVMSEFFGRVIGEDIVNGKTLKYALVYVMKAFRNRNNPNYRTFGEIALDNFKHRLYGWRDFVDQIANTTTIAQDFPEFLPYLQRPAGEVKDDDDSDSESRQSSEGDITEEGEESGEEDDDDDIDDEPTSPVMNVKTSTGFMLNVKILDKFTRNFESKKPDDVLEDRFRFIMNNLTEDNVHQKATEFMQIPEEYHAYFAIKLVSNRVCVEQNNLMRYSVFVEVCATMSKKFLKTVMTVTYEIIKHMYSSEKISREFSERSLFKTIGGWLGLLTIARDRPILKRCLDLRDLIIKSFQSGKLTASVPFVCRCLKNCVYSRVLRPPNPWIMSLLRILAEVHNIEELKLNIKFDIEMMCKDLQININEVPTDGILEAATIYLKDESNPDRRQTQKEQFTAENVNVEFDINKIPEMTKSTLHNLEEQIVISRGVEIFDSYPYLREVVVCALDHAIKEIIQPVVKRSVTIASRTSLDLVTKDFHMERDVRKVTQGAHMMVQTLASNLSMVTCKQPLRVAMESRMKQYLNAMCVVEIDPEMRRKIDETARRVTEENIHVGCKYVEEAAIKSATSEINQTLENEIQQRRKHHESGNRLPWTMYHRIFEQPLKHAPKLPEVLAPTEKIGRLQENVYKQFDNIIETSRAQNQTQSEFTEKYGVAESLIREIVEMVNRAFPQGTPNEPSMNELSDQNYQVISQKLLNLIKSAPNVFEFSVDVQRSILNRFYTCTSQLLKDVFIFILANIQAIDGNKEVEKMAHIFWCGLEDARKFNYNTIILLLGNILPVDRFDADLAKILRMTNDKTQLSFGVRCYEILAHPQQGGEMPRTFEVLLHRRSVLSSETQAKLELVAQPYYQQGGKQSSPLHPSRQSGDSGQDPQRGGRQFLDQSKEVMEKRNQILAKFVEWLELYELTVSQRMYPTSPKLGIFVKKELQDSSLIRTDGDFAELVTLLIIESVKYFTTHQKENIPLSGFRYVDAFSSLVAVYLRSCSFESLVSNLELCLSLVTKKLIEDHNKTVNSTVSHEVFYQKPYLRFLSNMLIELNKLRIQKVKLL